MNITNNKIAIIGLGYVGLPLALEFGKKFNTIGFDINPNRIIDLKNNIDKTLEVSTEELYKVNKNSNDNSNGLYFTNKLEDLISYNIYIITVPTPIDSNNDPDLKPIFAATKMVASILKKGDIIIYESTVYPGCVEEDCVPIIESVSNLKFNNEFYCGYSPERINPGDKINTLTKIKKITSGSTPQIAEYINILYQTIIQAGTHLAPSIKIAEAAKVIENAQRDLNIAFVNELSKIFGQLGIDVNDVIEAAGTKWNFIKYKPGLVGGHCIGVDPYYLIHKAKKSGVNAELISKAREVNESMSKYIVEKIKNKIQEISNLFDKSCLILGITFKENCPDIRNTKVFNLYEDLISEGFEVDIYDPNADLAEVKHEYGINLIPEIEKKYNIIIHAVAHDQFLTLDFSKIKAEKDSILFDIKSVLDIKHTTIRL